MPGRGSTVRLGRLAGIPIGIHPLWLLIVGLITWSLGHDYFPSADHGLSQIASYGLGLLAALGLFAGIVLHELGHAVVARRHGIAVEEIDLWLLGGVARLEGEAKAPGDELRFAAAGPAVTLAIAAVLGVTRVALGHAGPDWLRALVDYELYVNGAILALNLMPAFPLDGGRIFRSLLWMRNGDQERATMAAAGVGRMFGWGLAAFGGLLFFSGQPTGMWLALIGGFLILASRAEAEGSVIAHELAGRTAADLMSAPAITLSEDLTLAEAVTSGFSHHLFTAFPVVDRDGRAVGLISLADVRAAAPSLDDVRLSEAAHRDEALLLDPATEATSLLANPAFGRLGRAVVVDGDRHVLGIVSITDIQRRLRAAQLLRG